MADIPSCSRYSLASSPHSEADVKPRQRAYYERYLRIQAGRDRHLGKKRPAVASCRASRRPSTAFRLERLALDNHGGSHGRYPGGLETAARSLRDTASRGAVASHPAHSWDHFQSDHAVIFDILPISPETTLLRTKWLVHKDAVEGDDYELENHRVWRTTSRQDATFVRWRQLGVASPAYRSLLTEREPGREILGWYIEHAWGKERVPIASCPYGDDPRGSLLRFWVICTILFFAAVGAWFFRPVQKEFERADFAERIRARRRCWFRSPAAKHAASRAAIISTTSTAPIAGTTCRSSASSIPNTRTRLTARSRRHDSEGRLAWRTAPWIPLLKLGAATIARSSLLLWGWALLGRRAPLPPEPRSSVDPVDRQRAAPAYSAWGRTAAGDSAPPGYRESAVRARRAGRSRRHCKTPSYSTEAMACCPASCRPIITWLMLSAEVRGDAQYRASIGRPTAWPEARSPRGPPARSHGVTAPALGKSDGNVARALGDAEIDRIDEREGDGGDDLKADATRRPCAVPPPPPQARHGHRSLRQQARMPQRPPVVEDFHRGAVRSECRNAAPSALPRCRGSRRSSGYRRSAPPEVKTLRAVMQPPSTFSALPSRRSSRSHRSTKA